MNTYNGHANNEYINLNWSFTNKTVLGTHQIRDYIGGNRALITSYEAQFQCNETYGTDKGGLHSGQDSMSSLNMEVVHCLTKVRLVLSKQTCPLRWMLVVCLYEFVIMMKLCYVGQVNATSTVLVHREYKSSPYPTYTYWYNTVLIPPD